MAVNGLVFAVRLCARASASSRSWSVLRFFYERKSFVYTAGKFAHSVRPLTTAPPNWNVTIEELKEMVSEGKIQLFDVREPHELVQHGKIHISTNIPLRQIPEAFTMDLGDFEEKYGIKMPEKDDSDMVFHCKGGVRSQAAMAAVHKIGYSKARHFPGGYDEWQIVQG